MTPGQAAYEAYIRAEASQLMSPKGREMAIQGRGWDVLSPAYRSYWEAAAQAAIAAQQPQGAPACRDSLHGLLGTWREYSSAHATGTHDEIVERAAIKECADELEEILDGHPEPQPAPGLGWDGLRALSD